MQDFKFLTQTVWAIYSEFCSWGIDNSLARQKTSSQEKKWSIHSLLNVTSFKRVNDDIVEMSWH